MEFTIVSDMTIVFNIFLHEINIMQYGPFTVKKYCYMNKLDRDNEYSKNKLKVSIYITTRGCLRFTAYKSLSHYLH